MHFSRKPCNRQKFEARFIKISKAFKRCIWEKGCSIRSIFSIKWNLTCTLIFTFDLLLINNILKKDDENLINYMTNDRNIYFQKFWLGCLRRSNRWCCNKVDKSWKRPQRNCQSVDVIYVLSVRLLRCSIKSWHS